MKPFVEGARDLLLGAHVIITTVAPISTVIRLALLE